MTIDELRKARNKQPFVRFTIRTADREFTVRHPENLAWDEETGIAVSRWTGPVYQVEAVAEGLGWVLRAEIYRATGWTGEVVVEDPDGIVGDARFVPLDACDRYLEECHPWVREPLGAWLVERWEGSRNYRYRLDGDSPGSITVVKV